MAAGWQMGSAALGQGGNTVLIGHNNIYGSVFLRLDELKPGDEIQVRADTIFLYQVSKTMILADRDQSPYVRAQNAAWLEPSEDERLTLVTCWPRESNTHRLIILATPVGADPVNMGS